MTTPKYKVGDIVFLHKHWEDAGRHTYNMPPMDRYLGTQVTIASVHYSADLNLSYYRIEEDNRGFYWIEEMMCENELEDVNMTEFNEIIGGLYGC